MERLTLRPQLATLDAEVPSGDWLYEIKFDGYRILAQVDDGQVRLITRNGKDWTHRFPELAAALAKLPVKQAVLDGEVVALTADGISSFRELQEALSHGDTADLIYQAFDLLQLDHRDLTDDTNVERKEALAALFDRSGWEKDNDALVRYTDHMRRQGPALLDRLCDMGLEGVICKRADGRYRGGRSKAWRKVKCIQHEEFVVGGFSQPKGSRSGFGSLLLGAYDQQDRFQYAGRVGTGFSHTQLEDLHHALEQLRTDTSPFAERPPDARGVRWVTPSMVVEVEFTERTRDGVLRHPAFRGLREDRDATEIRWQRAEQTPAPPAPQRPRPASVKRGDAYVAGVRISHPDRVLYPEQGLTKVALARYYERYQDWVLPPLINRPLSLLRCPRGLDTECFYQKHPHAAISADVPRVSIEEKKGHADYVYVTKLSDLVALVQAGVMELHPWGSRVDKVERPDSLIFDLDPGPDVPWDEMRRVARWLRDDLEVLHLTGFLRTTGGKGLHVVVPLRRGAGWDRAKAFARAVCERMADREPDRLTTKASKALRQERIFLDYLRNGRGATAVASYSVRARPGAPVAVPLRWDELTPAMRPDRYNVDNLGRRLAALSEDPWAGFDDARRPLTLAMTRAVGLKDKEV